MITSIINESKRLGFICQGFTRPEKPLFFDQFCAWLETGKNGAMSWLGRHLDIRENPQKLLKGCQTLITLAYPYSLEKPCTPDGFTTARYTEPKKIDYHDRLKQLVQSLTSLIVEHYPEGKTRICVDSAPILERSFAYASGMGFIGKNNMLIIPGHGSFLLLVELLTTALLPFSKAEPMENQCGSCTLCLDACPTGALEKPFWLDASRCLSYLTIEHRGPVTSETVRKMGNCFYGCDVCQEVCPFNKVGLSRDLALPTTNEILAMQEKDFKVKFGKTAFARAGLEKVKENIRAVKSQHRR